MRRWFVPLALLALVSGACSVRYGSDPNAAQVGTRDVNVPLPSEAGGDRIVAVVRRVLPAVVNVVWYATPSVKTRSEARSFCPVCT